MPTSDEVFEFRELLASTQKELLRAGAVIFNAQENLIHGVGPEHVLWCATTAGLLIGLQQQIRNVRELIFDHPLMRVDPQLQPESE